MPSAMRGRTSLVNIDLFTGTYRVSGQVVVGSGGIHASLGDPNSDYLELEQVYISRINEPGKIVASYPMCALRKDNIAFIMLQDRRDGLPPSSTHSLTNLSHAQKVEVFVTVPSFEIKGVVPYDGTPNPEIMLAQTVSRYQTVYEAIASATLYPEITYQGDLILIDENQIGIFCLKASG